MIKVKCIDDGGYDELLTVGTIYKTNGRYVVIDEHDPDNSDNEEICWEDTVLFEFIDTENPWAPKPNEPVILLPNGKAVDHDVWNKQAKILRRRNFKEYWVLINGHEYVWALDKIRPLKPLDPNTVTELSKFTIEGTGAAAFKSRLTVEQLVKLTLNFKVYATLKYAKRASVRKLKDGTEHAGDKRVWSFGAPESYNGTIERVTDKLLVVKCHNRINRSTGEPSTRTFNLIDICSIDLVIL